MYSNLNETSPAIIQPNILKIELMEHQKRTIFAMNKLETEKYIKCRYRYFDNVEKDLDIYTQIGILGDKVGAGKTYEILGLICMGKNPNDDAQYFSSGMYIQIKSSNVSLTKTSSNMIVVPHKLISQWESSILNTQLSFYIIKDGVTLQNYDVKKLFNVVLVSNTLLQKMMETYKNVKWNRVFIDEADSIKITNIIHTNFLWLVTGTPMGLIDSKTKYLRYIFGEYIGWLPDFLVVKNNNDYIDSSIKLPKPIKIIVKCHTPPEVKLVKEFIPQHILTMINAGNTDEAIRALNCNEDTTDNIFTVITRNIRNAIDNKKIELEAEQKKKYSGIMKEEHYKKINGLQKLIQRLESRLDGVKKKLDDMNNEICPICLNEPEKPVVVDCCSHGFCFDCVLDYISKKNNCPNCTKKISTHNIHVIAKKDAYNKIKKTEKPKIKNKLDVLIDILKEKKDGKIMVFANYPQTFIKIESELSKMKISYGVLKGTDAKVKQTVADFEKGSLKVLMLNAKSFGAGMNLQMASDIVIYHRFTKEMEEQIIGRAQRIGREKQLHVYYLIHNNENESIDTSFKFDDVEYEKYLECDDDQNVELLEDKDDKISDLKEKVEDDKMQEVAPQKIVKRKLLVKEHKH
jgi:hypothetical protein